MKYVCCTYLNYHHITLHYTKDLETEKNKKTNMILMVHITI